MDFSLDTSKGKYQIRSYGPGKIKVNDTTYTQSVIISMTELLLWPPQSFAELTSENFAAVLALQPEIVILGTGAQQIFPAAEKLALLAEHNIGVEVMNTAAACRTFNVLAAEGRKVVVALLL